jgi:hypothetical protein
MTINFHLVDRRRADPGDLMGRRWFGWDPSASDQTLWDINRGTWRLGHRVTRERFATLSYRGIIRIAAEITDRERVGQKWALVGTVLRPGDPVRDQLVGQRAPGARNPFRYFDTPALDAMTTGVRARPLAHEPTTMLATWNPAQWPWPARAEDAAMTAAGAVVRGEWSTGVRKGGVHPGDRVFLLKQGEEPRGIVASGICTSRIFADQHWQAELSDGEANYVLIDWDTVVTDDALLPHVELVNRVPAGGGWRPQASGTLLSAEVASDLEAIWAEHLGRPLAVPTQVGRGQGWQLDAARRKKVEDVAQARLEAHYRALGWHVEDKRHGNSFDAIATKPNEAPLYLEAKGTETTGASVIVSRGEVAWARANPGRCVLGILSDVRFLPGLEIDQGSGNFALFSWNPDTGDLKPRAFDWAPPTTGEPIPG